LQCGEVRIPLCKAGKDDYGRWLRRLYYFRILPIGKTIAAENNFEAMVLQQPPSIPAAGAGHRNLTLLKNGGENDVSISVFGIHDQDSSNVKHCDP
jgi:hypothetical protein